MMEVAFVSWSVNARWAASVSSRASALEITSRSFGVEIGKTKMRTMRG